LNLTLIIKKIHAKTQRPQRRKKNFVKLERVVFGFFGGFAALAVLALFLSKLIMKKIHAKAQRPQRRKKNFVKLARVVFGFFGGFAALAVLALFLAKSEGNKRCRGNSGLPLRSLIQF